MGFSVARAASGVVTASSLRFHARRGTGTSVPMTYSRSASPSVPNGFFATFARRAARSATMSSVKESDHPDRTCCNPGGFFESCRNVAFNQIIGIGHCLSSRQVLPAVLAPDSHHPESTHPAGNSTVGELTSKAAKIGGRHSGITAELVYLIELLQSVTALVCTGVAVCSLQHPADVPEQTA